MIFICTFDPFGKGKPQYSFENICHEDHDLTLNDGTKKIFFNTTAYNKAGDEDVRDFLKYVNGEPSDNPFVKEIETKVAQVKTNKEWRQEYMTLLMREQEIREEVTTRDIKFLVISLKSFNIPNDAIVEQLIKIYHLTREEAKAYVKMTD